jgi:acetolactate synthase-1/2/3 large subunit
MASGRPRPTYVEVPLDVLDGCAEVTIAAAPAPQPMPPDPDRIARAVEAIAGAGRIVIYGGGGVIASGAGAALAALAERLGAPVLTSGLGKGAIPDDHPLALGRLWAPGNAVEEVLRSSDLAIVVGSKLGAGETETENWAMPLPERMVRVDVDPTEIDRHYPVTVPILADARLAVEALMAALATTGVSERGWTAADVAAIRERALATAWGREQAPYLDALRRAIPRDGVLTNDMTMMSYVADRLYPAYEPRTFLQPAGYGTLGFALPAAIGAKLARPAATVVAICGDGGFQYTMQEVATAIQLNLGIPIVIFNDSTYTAVKYAQAQSRNRRFVAVDLVNPDFVALANAYGVPGVRAESPADLEAAVVAAAQRDVPTIIDTPIRFDY